MPFPADTQLGPYKISALIGCGGMGEVYRARDTRLLRDVAIKILPASFTSDPDRLRRFEQEARAVAALNHPHVVSVYDVGESGGVHYIVSELLEGESLRQRIPTAGLPTRKAIELAVQLANGLAAAHEQGIVHRDLKPENIFVLRNGRLKILDFGLAKLRRSADLADSTTGVTQLAAETEAGQVLGTVGYMSPEQVRSGVIDHRSDIFSFGGILYEMLCGQRAFKRNTSAETMTAILNEDPQDFPTRTSGAIAPALERIVRHCLEKQPGQRFQSAHDIAFDLESLSGISGAGGVPTVPSHNRWVRPTAAFLAILVIGGVLGAWLRSAPAELHPKLQRVTFGRGVIWNARFMPDNNMIYGAAWAGQSPEIFVAPQGSTEARPLGAAPGTTILAVSNSGELAVEREHHFVQGFEFAGMLARAPVGGGAPRDILDSVEYADWSPDGAALAVVRRVSGKVRLEYPLGRVIHETPGWLSHVRVSPDGKLVAFIEHPYPRDDGGSVVTLDTSGNKKTISSSFVSAQGLAWRPDGSEVWFTATTSGSNRELRAVTLSGKERLVYLGTGTLTLQDISKSGRVMITRDDWRSSMVGLAPRATKETDLGWHDWTIPRDISDDGSLVAFDESGEAGGENGALYIRHTDGSPAVRLGDGLTPTLSPDGKWVLALVPASNRRTLVQLPTGAGEPRHIATGSVDVSQAYFFPDGRRIAEVGSASDSRGVRIFVQDLENGTPRPISPEGITFRYRGGISPDGKKVAALDPEGKSVIYDVAGGLPATAIQGAQDGDEPIQWTPDGKNILMGRTEIPNHVFIVNLDTGQRKLFKSFPALDPGGLLDNAPPNFSRDLKSYVYGYSRLNSDVYIVDGLK